MTSRMKNRLRYLFVLFPLTAALVAPTPAESAVISNCGSSGSHTVCVTVPDGPLVGETAVTITNSKNSGTVISTWMPSGSAAKTLIQAAGPYPSTNNYSFVWPTQKYLDASGILRVQYGSTSAAPVDVAVALSNGNTSDFQHSPNDWANFLPGAWNGPDDPVVMAVGDGPSNEASSNAVAARLAAIDPPLFLFLGDVYETGTFAENLNHYGRSALDVPGGGTMWGTIADATQPTVGNHEGPNQTEYIDYWHGRPLFTKFTFGGVLFLDLNSEASMSTSSQQYKLVQAAITDPAAPACVVTYWHIPAIKGGSVKSSQRAMWSLLADNGGDLLLTGHEHSMAEYKPLDAGFNAGTADAHMVELIAGSGGHSLSSAVSDSSGQRVAWSKGKTAGVLAMTLNGAANGGSASSIGWTFQDVSGVGLRSGSVDCAKDNRSPTANAGPDQTVTIPGQATMQASVADDGLPNPPGALTVGWSQVSGPGTATFTDPASPTTTVSFTDPGSYVLRLTANDSTLQASDDVTVTAYAAGTVMLNIPVAASADDAEESVSGSVSKSSSDLELVVDGSPQTVGLRFANVQIPPGASISDAYVQFEVDEVTTGAVSLSIQGQAADNPTTFSSSAGNISSRPRTIASVGWVPPAWPTVQIHGPDQRTPDISSIIREIIARPGWAAGNALAVIITGSGNRTAEAFDGTFAPVLHVTYSAA
jgi:K319L-like, PKD domain/Calcineurin-like phosphoesterase